MTRRYPTTMAVPTSRVNAFAPTTTFFQERERFTQIFGAATGTKLHAQGLSLAEAQKRFDATLGWRKRLDSMPPWMNLQQLAAVLGVSYNLFSAWAAGQLPPQHVVGNCQLWSRTEVGAWISAGCKWGGTGMEQPTLMAAVEAERKLARK